MGIRHGTGDIVTNGLVLCLDAGNKRSYPDTGIAGIGTPTSGIGTNWYDVSGTGKPVACLSGPAITGHDPQTSTVWLAARYNVSFNHYQSDNGLFGSGHSHDRTGRIGAAADPAININVGDTIKFVTDHAATLNNAAGGGLYIKHTQGAGIGNTVTNPIAINNGAPSNATITWTPSQSGTYYYQNSSRSNMWGYIYVSPKSATPSFRSMKYGGEDSVHKIMIPNTAQPNGLGTNFTIEIWNYWDNDTAPTDVWSGALFTNGGYKEGWHTGGGGNSGNNGLVIGFRHIVRRNGSGSEVNTAYSPAPSVKTWHQTVFTLNSGTGNVNVDTVNVMSNNTDFRSNYGQVTGVTGIGLADYYNTGNWQTTTHRGEFDGYIPIVRIYDKVLSMAEIEQNYNALKGRYI